MALPLIMFGILVLSAIILFIFGSTRESIGAGFSFTALSGVILILTGLFLWTGGLQLDTTSTMTTIGDTTTITYETMTFATNPEIMILSYLFTFGGFFPIVLSLRNVFLFKQIEKSRSLEEYE